MKGGRRPALWLLCVDGQGWQVLGGQGSGASKHASQELRWASPCSCAWLPTGLLFPLLTCMLALLLLQLATLPAHPESVPINALVAVKGTPMQDNEAPSGAAVATCI